MESLTFITEPLLHTDFVQFEVVVPLLEQLSQRYALTLAAPHLDPLVCRALEARGIRAVNGGARFPPIRRSRDEIPSYVVSWLRDAFWAWNSRLLERCLENTPGPRINISMTTAIDSEVWLIQSRPLGAVLEALGSSVAQPLRAAMQLAQPIVAPLDVRHLRVAGRLSEIRYSTTQHVAEWFADHGMPVAGIIPMFYRPVFRPSAASPSRDYVLAYVGKETDTTALQLLLRTGMPLRLFGSKSAGWVTSRLGLDRFPHARLYGWVSDAELCDLYTNARFTAFPFTEEPFGLVPLESMACGTPVLTYDSQGPRETVVDNETGWLTDGPQSFVRKAVEAWNRPETGAMRSACLHRAEMYHRDAIARQWVDLAEEALRLGASGTPRDRRARAG